MNDITQKIRAILAKQSAERKRLVENIVSLFILQGANYILPLITLPYLVRVLGPEKFGLIAFAQSLVQYFVIFTDYGFNLSATRQIVVNRSDLAKITRIFNAVIFIKFILMVISFIVLIFIIFTFQKFKVDWEVYLMVFFTVVGNVIFPVWFFQGIEKMRQITLFNVVARTFTTILIFATVKSQADYLLAAVLQSVGTVIAGTIALVVIFKEYRIVFSLPDWNEVILAVKEGWYVFISSAMATVLSNSGIFLLGLFQSKDVVGAYSIIEKVIKAILGLFSPITQALFPYINSRFSLSHSCGIKSLVSLGKYILLFCFIVSIITGLFSKSIVILLLGNNFSQYYIVVIFLAIWMFFSVLNNLIGIQYLITIGKAQYYSFSFILSNVFTVVAFLLLIPTKSYYGILIGINIGEILLTICLLIITLLIAINKISLENKSN